MNVEQIIAEQRAVLDYRARETHMQITLRVSSGGCSFTFSEPGGRHIYTSPVRDARGVVGFISALDKAIESVQK